MSAVPDPHVGELALLSYEPRRRSCKDLYKIPRKGDYIEVLWVLDDLPHTPIRWCPAEVLHVFGSPDQDCLAKGIIRYVPGETWGQQFHFVDFMEGHHLRCSGNEDEEEQMPSHISDQINDNPRLEWRFSSDPGEHSESESDDGNWCDETSGGTIVKRTKALIRAETDGAIGNQNSVEIDNLRNGHASLVVEVEKMKTQLLKLSQQLATVQRTEENYVKCTSSGCVLPRIRQKLALKMQGGIRQTTSNARKRKHGDPDQDLSITFVDGVYPGVIKARVECTLKQFESVSRHVRARSCSDTVFFFPHFPYTQQPLQGSLEFRILFQTFSHLCNIIGIVSPSDQKEMARKCGNGPKGELLRFLGTYSYDEKDECRSAHLFPGTSCGDFPPQIFERSTSDTASATESTDRADQLFPVLSRRTREWNEVDRRYRHKLRRGYVSLPALGETCPDLKAFAMTWKRAAELGGRGWSQALCDSSEVFGWLEISLPFVVTQGKHRCEELGGVGNDDMWDELLLKSISE